MTNITSEFLIWKNILKSNYQKGIKAFENILNNPYEIEKFIESQARLKISLEFQKQMVIVISL